MATFRVEAQVSTDELLKAVGQLSMAELEHFVSQVIALQSQRKAPSLPHPEAELLIKINQGIPANVQKRYEELSAKRKAESLTPEEHSELLRLTQRVEKIETQRIEYLAELARLRKTSLTLLMKNLNIRAPAYV